MYKIILASESPRRRFLLEKAGYHFLTIPTHISEILDKNLSIPQQVLKVASDKSHSLFQRLSQFENQVSQYKNLLLLSGDTVVVIDEKIIGKPKDQKEAFEILKSLSGRKHQVITAVSLVSCSRNSKNQFEILNQESSYEITSVQFKNLSDDQILDYIKTGEPMDKAGAYGYQDLGRQMVEKVDGPEDNVIGFPMSLVQKFIQQSEKIILKKNYDEFHKKIPSNVQIIAVSKKQSVEKIQNLFSCGQNIFAENYIQEAIEKIAALKSLPAQWHFIGQLQSNKVKLAVENFELIHSVDSQKLVEKMNQAASSLNKIQNILLQINSANEETKSGLNLENLEEVFKFAISQKNLKVCGFMCHPPLDQDPVPYFQELVKKGRELFKKYGVSHDPQFSMGTSSDFELAIKNGSTMVRLGTMLFGER